MAKYYFSTIKGNSPRFYTAAAILFVFVLGWVAATWYMFTNGIAVTSMTQQVPWGLVIVLFIYFVGLSAGSFIISAISVLFGQTQFKVFSRIAGFTAVLMIVAGLMMLISDWGRPDRILVPFIHVNPRSILSWNAFIYSTYIVNGILYLWALFKNNDKYVKMLAISATALAVGVHSGTGAIFGIINGRELFFSSLTPVAFVVSALSSGTGLAIILLVASFKLTKRPFDERLMKELSRLMAGLIIFVIYLMLIEHFVHLYAPEFEEGERYILFSGNGFTWMFWGGLIFMGGIVPVAILLSKLRTSLNWILVAAGLHVVGVLFERMVIVLPGQMLPQPLFYDSEVTSRFQDGVTASYFPNIIEFIQIGGVIAGVVLIYMMGLKLLPLLPREGKYIKEPKEEPEPEEAPIRDEPQEPEAPPAAAAAPAE